VTCADARSTVGVIIPTYNRADYLGVSIESVLVQTRPPAQVVVVDDGSTNETPAVVARYASLGVEYLSKANGGKAAAVNAGLQRLDCEFLWVFDDDDVACPNALERHLAVLERRPEVAFTVSGAYTCSAGRPDYPCVEKATPARPFHEDEALMELMLDCFSASPAVVARMSVVRAAGPQCETLVRSGDLEIAIRWLLRGPAARLPCGCPTYFRRYHDGLRGPQSRGFRYASNGDTARHFEQLIFERLLPGLPLSRFLPRSAWSDPMPEHREAVARIRRLALTLRKGLWARAEHDADALATNPPAIINRQEVNYLRRVFATGPASHALESLPRSTPVFRQLRRPELYWVAHELLRGLSYRVGEEISEGRFGDAARLAGAAFRLFPRAVLRLSGEKLCAVVVVPGKRGRRFQTDG